MKLNRLWSFALDQIDNLAHTLGGLSLETLAMFVGLGALGVAAFAIYAVMSIAHRGKD